MMKTNVSNVKEAVLELVEDNYTPILVSVHGNGKTEGIRSIAKEQGFGFTEIPVSNLEYGMISSPRPSLHENSVIYLLHTQVKQAIKESLMNPEKLHLVLLDEVNRSDTKILNEIMQIVQLKKIPGASQVTATRLTESGKYKLSTKTPKEEFIAGEDYEIVRTKNDELPKNIRFCMACNPASDWEGWEDTNYNVVSFDPAMVSRGVLIGLESTLKDWTESWATELNPDTGLPNIDPILVEFLSENPTVFATADGSDEKLAASVPRSWKAVSDFLIKYRVNKNTYTFNLKVSGIIGRDTTVMLQTFLDNYDNPMVKFAEFFKGTENPNEKLMDKIKNENMARQMMTVKSFLVGFDTWFEEKKTKDINANIHLMSEVITNLPNDMQVSMMTRIEQSHNKLHQKLWNRTVTDANGKETQPYIENFMARVRQTF